MAYLYDLTINLLSLMDMLYDQDIDEDQLLTACEAVELEIEEKADGYAKIMKEMDGTIAAMKAEEQRIKAKRTALENRQGMLKDNLETSMRAIGKTKFKTDLFSFHIQKNPPSLQIEKPKAFIDWCRKEDREDLLKCKDPEINTAAVKEAILKDGEIIDGAKVVRGEGLRIR